MKLIAQAVVGLAAMLALLALMGGIEQAVVDSPFFMVLFFATFAAFALLAISMEVKRK